MDTEIVAQVIEQEQVIDWEWVLICTPDKAQPAVDDSLDFDGILAEIEAQTDEGTAYGLIPWWLVEDERIGYEFCVTPWLW